MTSDRTGLLDQAFLEKLERLTVQARRAFPGKARGERRSFRSGASVEFRDFRRYAPGDDFRRLDWSIYARLDRLMLRQFLEEEDLGIDILIDQSSSMRFGKPVSKLELAVKVAAAIAFVATTGTDRVSACAFDSRVRSRTRSMRGRGHLRTVCRFLEELLESESAADQNSTDLGGVARSYPRLAAGRGVMFILSDFLDPRDYRRQLKILSRTRFDINLIQVLTREELEPTITGDLMLVDSETDERREVTINRRLLTSYKATLERFTSGLASFCRSNGIGYALARCDLPVEEFLLREVAGARMIG